MVFSSYSSIDQDVRAALDDHVPGAGLHAHRRLSEQAELLIRVDGDPPVAHHDDLALRGAHRHHRVALEEEPFGDEADLVPFHDDLRPGGRGEDDLVLLDVLVRPSAAALAGGRDHHRVRLTHHRRVDRPDLRGPVHADDRALRAAHDLARALADLLGEALSDRGVVVAADGLGAVPADAHLLVAADAPLAVAADGARLVVSDLHALVV